MSQDEKVQKTVVSSGVHKRVHYGSINGFISDILTKKPYLNPGAFEKMTKTVKTMKNSEISGFSQICQKPYPNPEAFAHFSQKTTTDTTTDTTSGRADRRVQNPYPILEESAKFHCFSCFSCPKWHFLECQVCR